MEKPTEARSKKKKRRKAEISAEIPNKYLF